MPDPAPQSPQSIVTLKHWRGRSSVEAWIYEAPDQVLKRMANPRPDGTLHLTMVMALQPRDLWTKPENIATVESYQ